jgi:hypothetical protein
VFGYLLFGAYMIVSGYGVLKANPEPPPYLNLVSSGGISVPPRLDVLTEPYRGGGVTTRDGTGDRGFKEPAAPDKFCVA